jgi:hypothetical protein
VLLLGLVLDLVIIGLLGFGWTPVLGGVGLAAAWLLLMILSCSKRIRSETAGLMRKFLDAAGDFIG